MDPFLAEIRLFPFAFAPDGWALCNGQLLLVAQNQALFSLIGSTYGGDGRVNFALPNLCGRVPVHVSNSLLYGKTAGEATHTLTINEVPPHNHTITANNDAASAAVAAGNVWANSATINVYANPGNTVMSPTALASSGQNQPHSNMQPYSVLNFCIATRGVWPPKD